MERLQEANGRRGQVRSAIHGELSNSGPQTATNPAWSRCVQLATAAPGALTRITASATIRAAHAMSSMRLNSAGLWLIPPLLATKSMAAGRRGARIAVSCRAPLAVSGSGESEAPRRLAQARADPAVQRHRRHLLRARKARGPGRGSARDVGIPARAPAHRPSASWRVGRRAEVDAEGHAARGSRSPRWAPPSSLPTVITVCPSVPFELAGQGFQRQ